MSSAVFTCAVCDTRNRDTRGAAASGSAVMKCAVCGNVIEPTPSLNKLGPSLWQGFHNTLLGLSALIAIALTVQATGLLATKPATTVSAVSPPRTVPVATPSAPSRPPAQAPAPRAAPAAASAPATVAPPASRPAGNVPAPATFAFAQPFPDGIRVERYTDPMAPFALTTPAGDDVYYAKLVDVNTGLTAARIYMRGGERREFKVPLGHYELRYATGPIWYGEQDLFGQGTVTTKADRTMRFQVVGNSIEGHQVRLIKQVDGNLSTSRIPRSQF